MQVINGLGSRFDSLCDELAHLVQGSFAPDLVVGIATGGIVVGEKVAQRLNTPLATITRQRAGTRAKDLFRFSFFLPLLPYCVSNHLRVYEVRRAEARFRRGRRVFTSRPVVISDQEASLIGCANRILVVDDSVDSGATFNDCLRRVRDINPAAELRTAAITSTFQEPAFVPDYLVMKHTLIRFPWAKDVGWRK